MITLPENWLDWTITGQLGQGSYSVVYDAVRKDDPSIHCAIKIIAIPQDDTEYDDLVAEGFDVLQSRSFFEEIVRDFTHEIRLMEQFKGMQNIVSIEDYKVVPKEDGIGKYIFIRMELLSSLEKYINDKTLSETEILQIGADICTALEFCQAKKIIHRDIKPANIFVNDRIGTHVFYKLGDFGIARNLEGKTQGMSAKGTPNYMAPEVASGLPYDARADIYSLGLTLYWLLNEKRLPFFPQTQLYSPAVKREALARRMRGDILPTPLNASEQAGKIILKACAFKPEDRYASATEMKQEILELLKMNGVSSEDQEQLLRDLKKAPKQIKIHGPNGVLMVVAIVAIIAAGIWLNWPSEQENDTTPEMTARLEMSEQSNPTEIIKTDMPSEVLTVTSEEEGSANEQKETTEESSNYIEVGKINEIQSDSVEDNIQESPEEEFEYEILEDGNVKITKYLGNDEVLKIPHTLNGKAVHTIGEGVLFSNEAVLEVIIPEEVHELEKDSFFGCNIIRVHLPSGLSEIEGNPFSGCDTLQEILLSNENTEFIVVDNVLFDANMERLITYPSGKKETTYIVPDSVRIIGSRAFYYSALEDIQLPKNLETIDEEAFLGCRMLSNITLPENLKKIGGYAFESSGLEKVTIPEGITVIEKGVFADCWYLENVELSQNLISIGEDGFARCTNLREIKLPEKLKILEANAFLECSSLLRVNIPEDLITIEGNPFANCDLLSEFVISEQNTYFYISNDALIERATYRLICHMTYRKLVSYTVPEEVRFIGNSAFYGNKELIHISLPEKLMGIEQSAFQNCINLVVLEIPETTFKIGDSAFAGCNQLHTVSLPKNLFTIERSVFSGCSSLSTINIPEEVTHISAYSFNDCSALKELIIPAGVNYIESGAFAGDANLKLVVVKNTYAEQYCLEHKVSYTYSAEELETETTQKPPEWLLPANSSPQESKTEEPSERLIPVKSPQQGSQTEEPFPDWLLDDGGE